MRPTRDPGTESPTIEVVAFRHGREIGRELCETSADAAAAVGRWTDEPGVVCQVDDLSVHHDPGDILDPTVADDDDEPPVLD